MVKLGALLVVNVGARGDEVAAREVLVEVRVVPTVQLVDGHLPNGMGTGRTVLRVAVALVGHPTNKLS